MRFFPVGLDGFDTTGAERRHRPATIQATGLKTRDLFDAASRDVRTISNALGLMQDTLIRDVRSSEFGGRF